MDKEKCFIIDEKILYLEKVLVDFENIPIFFYVKVMTIIMLFYVLILIIIL